MRISDWSSDVCSSDLEQALVLRGIAGLRQSDNDDMDMRLAARVGTPCKGAVREGNFQPASVEEGRPELRHLLALRDRVGRDEADACGALPDVPTRRDEPGGHVIERAAGLPERGEPPNLRALAFGLVLCADEGRIAEDVGACLRR